MVQRLPTPNDRAALLLRRLDELRLSLRTVDPTRLAEQTGSVYRKTSLGSGEFCLMLWGEEVYLTFPELVAQDGSGQHLNPALQALLIYYFHTSDGTKPAYQFVAFSELPDGKFYTQAFQGYTGEELRRGLGEECSRFEMAAQKAGGAPYPLGDSAFTFQFLPKVSLLVVFWAGDEDFPSAYQILFDAATPHHLPTDACAIAGSMLTRRLLSVSE